MLHSGRRMLSIPAHMQLINYQITQFPGGLGHVSPVKNILHYSAPVSPAPVLSPASLSGDHPRIRVQKYPLPVKNHTFLGVIGTSHPVGILEFFNIQSKHNHGINIPDFVFVRKGKLRIRLFFPLMKQQQLTGSPKMGMHRETHSIGQSHGSVYIKETGPYGIAPAHSHRRHGNGIFRNKPLCVIFQIFPFTLLSRHGAVQKTRETIPFQACLPHKCTQDFYLFVIILILKENVKWFTEKCK